MRHATAALFVSLLLGGSRTVEATEHLVELTRDQARDFARELVVAPGKFKEVCVPLKAADRVQWRFSSSAETAFNVHYHVGNQVTYPEKRDAVSEANGVLAADRDEHYCWMWKAGERQSTVSIVLKASSMP